MDDYIKRSDVLSVFEKRKEYAEKKQSKTFVDAMLAGYCEGAIVTINQIASAADVRENVHGDWIYQDPLFVDTIMCSVCGYNLPSDEFKTNFCPNCGADMRGAK